MNDATHVRVHYCLLQRVLVKNEPPDFPPLSYGDFDGEVKKN